MYVVWSYKQMNFKLQLALLAVITAVFALAPSAAQAGTRGMQHAHAHQFHDRTPRVHDHGAHSHRS
jgi:hypothetical protein